MTGVLYIHQVSERQSAVAKHLPHTVQVHSLNYTHIQPVLCNEGTIMVLNVLLECRYAFCTNMFTNMCVLTSVSS